jgi:ligand-binding SRPBCC domain-containing protein
MPNINIQTLINRPAAEVFSRFDKGLFEKLIPPFAIAERNDGIYKGAIISVGFKIPFMKTWHSEIIDKDEDSESFWFTDKGISGMPFGIKEWYHTHRVKILNENQCLIIDEIHFQTGNKLLDKITKWIFTRDMKGRSKGYKNFFESL